MRFVLALGGLTVIGGLSPAAEVDRELFQECRAKWQLLEQAGSQLEVAYTFSVRELPNRPPVVSKRAVLVGGEKIIFRSEETDVRVKPNDYVERITGMNSQYAFRMRRKRDSSSFVVTFLGPPDQDLRMNLAGEVAAGAGAPWSFLKPLTQLVDDPAFQIAQITRDTRNGRPVVKLVGKYSPNPPTPAAPALKHLELVFDPSTSLSVLAYSAELVSGLRMSGRIEHVPNLQGLPIPSTYTLTHHDAMAGDRTYEVAFTKWLYRDTVAEDEFRLSAFGLPEPVGFSPPTKSYRWAWLLGGSLLSALLAIVIYRRRKASSTVERTPDFQK